MNLIYKADKDKAKPSKEEILLIVNLLNYETANWLFYLKKIKRRPTNG